MSRLSEGVTLLLRGSNFDLVRDLRRHRCLEQMQSRTGSATTAAAMRAFVTGAASCSVSLDINIESTETSSNDVAKASQCMRKPSCNNKYRRQSPECSAQRGPALPRTHCALW